VVRRAVRRPGRPDRRARDVRRRDHARPPFGSQRRSATPEGPGCPGQAGAGDLTRRHWRGRRSVQATPSSGRGQAERCTHKERGTNVPAAAARAIHHGFRRIFRVTRTDHGRGCREAVVSSVRSR
jgi:hypothetical protein